MREIVEEKLPEDPEDVARWKFRLQQVEDAWRARDQTLGDDYQTIPEFYRGQHVFITGASGFLGKLVVEKLLRSCPEIGNIYVLLRTRRGMTVQDRLSALLQLPIFDKLRKERPADLLKVIPVQGDCSEEGLGLESSDRQTLVDTVSVVFHSAASVRFTDPIRKAVMLNTRSTRDIVNLAKEMKNLKVLVHISTTYCFSNQDPTMERVYPTEHDWRDVLKYAKLPDSYALDFLGPKFLGFQPNSYVFSKALSEQVIEEASHEIPITIVRPSIVTGSLDEPIPGWMDNLNGFAMFWGVSCKGVIRIIDAECGGDKKFDLIPADSVTNATITASWAKGTSQPLLKLGGNTEVVNASVGDVKPTTYNAMAIMSRHCFGNKLVAYSGQVRYPMCVVISNKYLAVFLKFFYHLVFGALLDMALVTFKRKPMVLDVYRKAEIAFVSLRYFMTKEFKFDTTNYWRLQAMLHPKDRVEFNLKLDKKYGNILKSSKDQLSGVRDFALKEPMKNQHEFERALKYMNWLWIAELCWYAVLCFMTVLFIAWKFS